MFEKIENFQNEWKTKNIIISSLVNPSRINTKKTIFNRTWKQTENKIYYIQKGKIRMKTALSSEISHCVVHLRPEDDVIAL